MSDSNNAFSAGFWEIYKNLTEEEAMQFTRFCGSPFITSGKNFSLLAEAFCSARKKPGAVSRESVFLMAFPGKKYNRQMMNNYLTEIKKILQRFLQFNWLEKNETIKNFALTESYFSRGLLTQFEKQLRPEATTENKYSPELLYYQFRREQLEDEFHATLAKKRSYDRLEPVIGHFTEYYFIETLRMYCELVNRRNLRSQDFSEKSMQHFLHFMESAKISSGSNELLSAYHAVFQFLMEKNNEDLYQQYKHIISASIRNFTPATARELCLYGQNHCIRHINRNNEKYLKELLDLYDLMLKANVMYEGPYMTQYTFKNYITVALRLKAYKEAAQFIQSNYEKLHPENRANAYHYNLAAVYFEENNFDAAQLELNHIQVNDPVYYLDSRCILLKIYFQQGDHIALTSLYHSMRVYLLRVKHLTKKQADLYRYLFLFTYRLSGLQTKFGYIPDIQFKTGIKKLTEKIEATDIANKTWLLARAKSVSISHSANGH